MPLQNTRPSDKCFVRPNIVSNAQTDGQSICRSSLMYPPRSRWVQVPGPRPPHSVSGWPGAPPAAHRNIDHVIMGDSSPTEYSSMFMHSTGFTQNENVGTGIRETTDHSLEEQTVGSQCNKSQA